MLDRFDQALDAFEANNPFSGPSLYFHEQTVRRRHEAGSARSAIQDERFVELLYATLTSWGMHRMGPGSAKLAEFQTFRRSLSDHSDRIDALVDLRLDDLTEADAAGLAGELWLLMSSLRVSRSEAQLVAGSKTLHHLLPQLVPPIDRAYTLRQFFYGYDPLATRGGETVLKEIFPLLALIAREGRSIGESRLGTSMNTSLTKVADNAIVGFVLIER